MHINMHGSSIERTEFKRLDMGDGSELLDLVIKEQDGMFAILVGESDFANKRSELRELYAELIGFALAIDRGLAEAEGE